MLAVAARYPLAPLLFLHVQRVSSLLLDATRSVALKRQWPHDAKGDAAWQDQGTWPHDARGDAAWQDRVGAGQLDFPSAFADRAPRDVQDDRPFLSSTLGSNMVLQRAPQRALVWGFAAPGTAVNTTLDGSAPMTVVADAAGVWRQQLPAVESSREPHTLEFQAASGEVARLENVLFGDVYLCGGQSNMMYPTRNVESAKYEAIQADALPLIRIFTVGTGTTSAAPLQNLRTVYQRWSNASASSISTFSAVCWIFGRELFKHFGGRVPIGLVSSSWGGTRIESWSPRESLESCDVSAAANNNTHLYNAMIHPYTVGPMALTGFAWYHGEANAGHWKPYACMFTAMISAWRRAFRNPEAYFGFVQISTLCAYGVPEMRTLGQMPALSLPKVGYATCADHGRGCDPHPKAKQDCAVRLAKSALALQYNVKVPWRSPSFSSQAATAAPPSMLVQLKDVSDAGVRTDQYPFNWLGGNFSCAVPSGGNHCAWAELLLQDGTWVNASIAAAGPASLRLVAPEVHAGAGAPVASRYGWNSVPMMSVYDRQTGLPLLPWSTVAGS